MLFFFDGWMACTKNIAKKASPALMHTYAVKPNEAADTQDDGSSAVEYAAASWKTEAKHEHEIGLL